MTYEDVKEILTRQNEDLYLEDEAIEIAIECVDKQAHFYTLILRTIDDIVYDHTDTITYKIIMSQIYELFGLGLECNE